MLPDDAPFVAHKLEELGVTAAELARLIRVPVADVEAWVAGTAEPAPPTDILIAFMGTEPEAAIQVRRQPDGRPHLVNGASSPSRP